jgi:drug/metabolite transporter (DMT)-like permease
LSVPPLLAALIALSGNFCLSLGMTLQKRHVGWIGSTPRKRPPGKAPGIERRRAGRFYRDMAPWFLGFALMNAAPVFSYFALMGLSTNVVGSFAGMSVAFTALLAKLWLKERLGRRRLAWTIALFAAIGAAGLLGEGGSSGAERFSPAALYLFLCLPLAAGAALLASRGKARGPRLAAAIAAASGSLAGFMVFPLRALQVAAAPGIAGWLASPYLYAYLAAGISSFVLVQAAYKDGEMAAVAPALYGMQVLWPALGSLFVFGSRFDPAQAAAFVGVAVCVAAIAGVHATARPAKGG